MKKALGYILVFALLTVSLTACGGNTDMREGRNRGSAERSVENGVERAEEKLEKGMEQMASPMPDVNDGIVNDDNGFITEGDNGPLEKPAVSDSGKTHN